MILPRDVQLSRVSGLRAAHRRIAALACDADVSEVTDRLVLVPTEPAGRELRRTLEFLRPQAALPAVLSTGQFYRDLHRRLGEGAPAFLTRLEREAIIWRASDTAVSAGRLPPFALRPGIVAEMLSLYDAFRRHSRNVDDFERVLVWTLAPGSEIDRGAARLLAQTEYLVAVYRAYEDLIAASGVLDEHRLRTFILERGLAQPIRRMIITTADQASEPEGLWPADFDLLTRLEGLARVDIVATDHVLDSGFRERLFDLLPGLEESRGEELLDPSVLQTPSAAPAALFHVFRDREEELLAVCSTVSEPNTSAVVYERPLPYLYLARRILEDAGLAFVTSDALPLAAEPYVAVLDLVFEAIASGFAREPVVRLLESPYLGWRPGGRRLQPRDVVALRAWLREHRVRGGPEEWPRVCEATLSDRDAHGATPLRRAVRALRLAVAEVTALDREGPTTGHFRALRDLIERRATMHPEVLEREGRARTATLALLEELTRAYAGPFDRAAPFLESAATVRRAIEQHTFAPKSGDEGLRFCDARAARYVHARTVRIVGVNEGDWPRSVRRSIFYPSNLMKDLGFAGDQDRQRFSRAAFLDLLQLASQSTAVSLCQLEDDALVRPSIFVEELDDMVADGVMRQASGPTISLPVGGHSAPGIAADVSARSASANAWRDTRVGRRDADPQFHGDAGPAPDGKLTVTQVERYVECPFKFFASVTLRVDEEDDRDDVGLDPRRRGTLVHRVFQAFFERWIQDGRGAITPAALPDARALFAQVVDHELDALPTADRTIESARLVGSAGGVGFGERVFRLEANRPEAIVERLLEFDLRGTYEFGVDEPVRVTLTGMADRIDLLADGTLRLVDYKTGQAPNPKRSIQLPVYGLCAEQKLSGYRGRQWRVGEAAYLALGDDRPWVSVVRDASDRRPLEEARQRFLDAVAAIRRGDYPPAPAERRLCGVCAFGAVCRKDYVAVES